MTKIFTLRNDLGEKFHLKLEKIGATIHYFSETDEGTWWEISNKLFIIYLIEFDVIESKELARK